MVAANTAIFNASNRAFRYGDGFFESARIINGEIPLFNRHYNRIVSTSTLLKTTLPTWCSKDVLRSLILDLIKKNNIENGGRLRITFYRKNAGFYAPENNELEMVAEVDALQDSLFVSSTKGLTVDLYSDLRKPLNFLSNLKTNNCLIYVMAAIFTQEKNLDNAILLNDHHNVAEAMNANIFIVSNGVMYTPPLKEACLDGVMRNYVIECAGRLGIKVYENDIKPNDLIRADELFMTNGSSGIQWVSAYKSKRYFNTTSEKILNYINTIISKEESVENTIK
jgi:branched-subunit amino acid aminotransferase/4-amino-4-deoxychorismate lyase